MFDCFRRTVAEEGVSALFHGLSANYIKIMPSIAIAFVVYDQLKIILKPEIKISAG
jgi:solute carrier family 25 phosphate transporter 23/24/25/41